MHTLSIWLASIASIFSVAPQAANSTATHAKLPIKILYAGDLDSPHSAHWMEFLAREFEHVESTSLDRLSNSKASSFDVVVADWKRRYVPNADGKIAFDGQGGHGYSLPDDFAKPVIMLGAVGGEIVRGSKIGWL